MHKNERLHFLFRRYLDNSCTRDELTELLALSQEEGLEQDVHGELKEYWKSLDTVKLQDEVDWAARYEHIIDISQSTLSFDQNLKSGFIGRQLWRVAAVVLVIAGAAFAVWNTKGLPKNEVQAATEAPVKQEDSSAHGQLINLPDGSTVVLNKNSKLEYPPHFNAKTRDVYLNGEAFFDIKHNPSKPFIVHTGSISTKVLGTAFNIQAYRSKSYVEVTVTRGKVEVRAKKKLLGVLQKNEQIVFHTGTESFDKKTLPTEPVVAWRKYELYFDEISFAEAALVLSNRYHVSIEFLSEKLRGCQFTAAFNNSTTLEHILTVICELNNATYRIEGNNIFIDGQGCE
jgi:ferric-dicitrate binding protein FerR (iron transport regulator)